jgi:hypothetical protein
MSDGRLDVTYYGMRPATRADWDALRSERDAWKARAERLISDAADIQRYWQDEGVRGDGFCFSLNCLLRDAGLEEPLDALAEPQPPAEPALPTTRGSPGFRPRPPCIGIAATGHNPSIRQGTSSRRLARPAQISSPP